MSQKCYWGRKLPVTTNNERQINQYFSLRKAEWSFAWEKNRVIISVVLQQERIQRSLRCSLRATLGMFKTVGPIK